MLSCRRPREAWPAALASSLARHHENHRLAAREKPFRRRQRNEAAPMCMRSAMKKKRYLEIYRGEKQPPANAEGYTALIFNNKIIGSNLSIRK